MYRTEYPRPQWRREEFQIINGSWQFAFDDDNRGSREKWYRPGHKLLQKIEVPFAFQSSLSGICDASFHDIVWYKRQFKVASSWQGKHVLLNFGAVDYEAAVYVNGELVGTHVGGNTSFSFDITDFLHYDDREELCVRCADPSEDQFIPRGKQYWKEKSEGIWYTRTTGIWQTVWLEAVNATHMEHVYMTPDIDEGTLRLCGSIQGKADHVRISIRDDQGTVLEDVYSIAGAAFERTIPVFGSDIMKTFVHSEGKLWSPEHPHLYDITFELYSGGKMKDRVDSYFGMRKIHASDGIIYLNNRPYRQKLVLDQGYFQEGLLTAPSADDLLRDILLAKEMGFNGCRKHQKVEDPLFMYYADREGFLVWGEMANAANYSEEYALAFTKEWCDVLRRDYNHPCIICWVPLNESWGVPNIATDKKQQSHAMCLYYLTKSFDQTRLVISNDGWEMVKTDICGLHNYSHGRSDEQERQELYAHTLSTRDTLLAERAAGRDIYVGGFENEGVPVMLTEFGGIAYTGNNDGWGYTVAGSEEEFFEEFERIMKAVHDSKGLCGYVYTQLTDVEQEINGLLRYDRTPKFSLKAIKRINNRC